MAVSNPLATASRRSALEVLTRVAAGEQLGEALDAVARGGALPRRDAAFVEELVKTAVRHRRYLDYQIDRRAARPGRLPPAAREVLRLGAAEVMLLRTPPYAAVNEAVKLAKEAAGPAIAAVVNGVLRRLAEEGPAAVTGDPLVRLAVEHSFPDWLVRRWAARRGHDETAALLAALNSPAPLTIYPSPKLSCRAELAFHLREAGCEVETGPFLSLVVRASGPLTELPGYNEGWFHIVDPSSSLAPGWLAPPPGATVLDLCAGAGGKTFFLAWAVGSKGKVVAVDRNKGKLAQLEKRAAAFGLTNIEIVAGDVLGLRLPRVPYVLLDAPCTNIGVIRRKPDIKWRLQPEDLTGAAEVQEALFRRAWEALSAGGRLVYFVCSPEEEEGEEVVERVMGSVDGGEIQPPGDLLPAAARDGRYLRTWPHRHGTNGSFGACVGKAAG